LIGQKVSFITNINLLKDRKSNHVAFPVKTFICMVVF